MFTAIKSWFCSLFEEKKVPVSPILSTYLPGPVASYRKIKDAFAPLPEFELLEPLTPVTRPDSDSQIHP